MKFGTISSEPNIFSIKAKIMFSFMKFLYLLFCYPKKGRKQTQKQGYFLKSFKRGEVSVFKWLADG